VKQIYRIKNWEDRFIR